MNQKTPRQKKVVNTLSVRLPPELYNQIAEIALEKGDTLNSVFINVVTKGLERSADNQRAIEDFVISVVSPERMKELIHGRQGITTVTT